MITSSFKKRIAFGLVAVGVAAGAMVGTSASADPAQFSGLVGVGSDTTQDVLNGFAGRSNNQFFTPISSSSATGKTQVVSFDATGSSCIIPKPGYGAYDRPNGSSNGARALSRALDGAGWGVTAASGGACGRQDVGGAFDFGRSSSLGSGTTGTLALTYIPFGRDAVSFATYRAAGSPVTSLTRKNLKDLFSSGANGSITVGGVKIIACGIQSGSGTFTFWNGVHAGTDETNSTKQCRDLVNTVNVPGSQANGRLQENDGVQLKQAGDLVAAQSGESGTQVIIGFSAGAYIAKSNGYADPTPPSTVGMGSISDDNVAGGGANLGSPISGTAPNLTPNATFYASTWVGRDIYNIVPSAVIDDPAPNAAQSLFKGSSSAVCLATNTLRTFGFESIANCGTTTDRYALRSGQQNA